MSDKVVHFTMDGYIPSDASGNTIDIPLTSGTLLEVDATYMFEINIVAHSREPTEYFAMKAFDCFNKRNTTVVFAGATVVWDDGGYTSASLSSSYVSGTGCARFSIALPINFSGFYWRAWIDVYVKDNEN